MNESNNHARSDSDGDASEEQQQQGASQSRGVHPVVQQERQTEQYEDSEEGLIVQEEIRTADSATRGEVRRQYRRRMTLDPLVDFLDDGGFFDGEEGNGSPNIEVQNNVNQNQNNEGEQGNGMERLGMNVDAELFGEFWGRVARRQSGHDSSSSEEEDGYDSEDEGNDHEPPQPARNHSYLPTAQPLYPEEWIPAGQHRLRLSRGGDDLSASSLDAFVDDNVNADAAEKNVDNSESASLNQNKIENVSHGIDVEIQSPSSYDIPEPPTLFQSHSNNKTQQDAFTDGRLSPIQTDTTTNNLPTLAIMEMDDIVLFPGAIIPLRLRDRNWVTYLGQLIDDARGLYGSHQGTSRGMGEVRIVILPRVRDGMRRTRRRPRQGGSRTGRWRIDLIRRGVTGMRRFARRRLRSESVETEPSDNPTREENEDEGNEHDATSLGVGRGNGQRRNDSPEQSSSSDEDDFFHPTAPARPPVDDPLIGRIGTLATITYTHEMSMDEDTNHSGNPEGSLSASAHDTANSGVPSSQRPSSMVWRDRGGELVVTVLGTNRVRLVCPMKEEKSTQGRNAHVPLYAVEEIHDRSALMPPTWMLLPPGDSRFSIAALHPDRSFADNEEGEDIGPEIHCDNEQRAVRKGCGANSGLFQNLSLRSSSPAIVYQTVWPWLLCQKICNIITETDQFQGLGKILHSAAGLHFTAVEEQDDIPTVIASDGTSPARLPVQLRIVNPSAFANWIAANMPLSQNDRLDLLEMTCTVQQLKYIHRKLEEKKQEAVLRCKHCGAAISQMQHVFSVGGSEGTTGAYVNEHGIVHQTMTLRKVDNHSVVCIGSPETKDSWFPGYSWTIAYCSICSDHLGWKFRRVGKGDDDDPARPRTFWGFSSITTDKHVAPRRVSFQTRTALAMLLQYD